MDPENDENASIVPNVMQNGYVSRICMLTERSEQPDGRRVEVDGGE